MRRVVVLALLALVGCSADEEPASTPTETAPPATAPTSTATEEETEAPGPSVAQYAGVVATVRSDWLDATGEFGDECPAWYIDSEQLCKVQILSLTIQAQTVGIVIAGASDPRGSKYLGGPPPAEIADLYDDTLTAVAAIETAEERWNAAGCLSPGAACDGGEDIALGWAIGDLTESLQRWDPYL